jgi:hypothetical protein
MQIEEHLQTWNKRLLILKGGAISTATDKCTLKRGSNEAFIILHEVQLDYRGLFVTIRFVL